MDRPLVNKHFQTSPVSGFKKGSVKIEKISVLSSFNLDCTGLKFTMEKILIVYKDRQVKQSITQELEKEGYDIRSIEADTFDLTDLDASGFSLAVITLYKDVPSTWDMFLAFKEHFRDLPVVAYIGQHGGAHLKSAVKKVLSK